MAEQIRRFRGPIKWVCALGFSDDGQSLIAIRESAHHLATFHSLEAFLGSLETATFPIDSPGPAILQTYDAKSHKTSPTAPLVGAVVTPWGSLTTLCAARSADGAHLSLGGIGLAMGAHLDHCPLCCNVLDVFLQKTMEALSARPTEPTPYTRTTYWSTLMDATFWLVLVLGFFLVPRSFYSTANGRNNRRLERKIDLILRHLGIDPNQNLDANIMELMKEGQKIQAVNLYREQTGAGLKDAKDHVESLMRPS